MINRRNFLNRALSVVAATAVTPLAPNWVIRTAAAATTDKTLLCIFLRGGCDGLNCVVPHGDDEYHRQRPSIRIPSPGPGATDAALNLDGYFGLHPALRGLFSLYGQGKVALLPAVHFPNASRSHFENQAALEAAGATDGSGWLNRYLVATGGGNGLRGVALAPSAPDALKGSIQVRTLNNLGTSVLSRYPDEESRLVSTLSTQHQARPAGSEPAVLAQLRESGALALQDLQFLRELGASTYAPGGNAVYPATGLGARLRDAALLIKGGYGLEVATIDFGGWDTHVGQGNGGVSGRQARLLAELDAGLTALMTDLGPAASKVTVLVMTEFGRTLAQNANAGTDHGNASSWFVLGGAVRGGIYSGPAGWPGLAPEQLRDGRDLRHSVEFNNVMAELLLRHLSMPSQLISTVLPGTSTTTLGFI